MIDKGSSGLAKMSHLSTIVTISVSEAHGSEIVFEVAEASEGGSRGNNPTDASLTGPC